MKLILVALLIALAVAGGANYCQRIALQRGVQNSINFACGNQDNTGNWNLNSSDQYSYSCTGQPNWLSWNGSSLSGSVPANWQGKFQIQVGYNGNTSGSNTYQISCDDTSQADNSSNIWWWGGAVPATWTIACPTIAWNATSAVTTPTVTIPQITIPQVVVSGFSIPSAPFITGINTGMTSWGSGQGNGYQNSNNGHGNNSHSNNGHGNNGHGNGNGNANGNSNANGNAYGNTNGNASDYNCGNVNWSGSGIITSVDSDSCTLDNGKTIKYANCSSRSYRSGRSTFSVSDKVNYQCYNDGTTNWAKSVECTS